MALLSKKEIIEGLERLGRLAHAQGLTIELVVVGGAVMALAYNARQTTRDVDAVIISPEARVVRNLAAEVARERGWNNDWLNDAAKGYLVGLSEGPMLLEAPGIQVRSPALAQLLAMKLSAWRDDLDIADAQRLLRELRAGDNRETIWQSVQPYLVPGDELKAQYAFHDLWETMYGNKD